MNWKAAATVPILLIIILFAASYSPTLGNLLQGAQDRITDMFGSSPIGDIFVEDRPVNFVLELEDYGFITTNTGPLDIEITSPNFLIWFDDGIIESNGTVLLKSYHGLVSVNGTQLRLDGSVEALESQKLSLNMKGSVKTTSTFTRLVIENMKLSEFSVDDATASLTVGDTTTKVIGKSVQVKAPEGKFTFSDGLKIEGAANSISIPDANINIS